MGNMFIRMVGEMQCLVSYRGSNRTECVDGWVVYSEGDRFLVLMRDLRYPSNAAYAGFICPVGDCARDMSKADTDAMVVAYDRSCEVAA